MNNFLCFQRSFSVPSDPPERPSPAQMQDMYAKFNEWRETFSENIIDLGGRLGDGTVVKPAGATDGPFIETKELIGGYMIIAADSLDQAVEIASGCPGLIGPTSGVEVREIRTMGQ